MDDAPAVKLFSLQFVRLFKCFVAGAPEAAPSAPPNASLSVGDFCVEMEAGVPHHLGLAGGSSLYEEEQGVGKIFKTDFEMSSILTLLKFQT